MLVTDIQATEPLFPYYELIYSFHLKSKGKKHIHMKTSCVLEKLPEGFCPCRTGSLVKYERAIAVGTQEMSITHSPSLPSPTQTCLHD